MEPLVTITRKECLLLCTSLCGDRVKSCWWLLYKMLFTSKGSTFPLSEVLVWSFTQNTKRPNATVSRLFPRFYRREIRGTCVSFFELRFQTLVGKKTKPKEVYTGSLFLIDPTVNRIILTGDPVYVPFLEAFTSQNTPLETFDPLDTVSVLNIFIACIIYLSVCAFSCVLIVYCMY